MSKTINQVKEYLTTLGISAEIKFNGKTLSINGNNFRIPKKKEGVYGKGIDFDSKVINYVRTLFPENIENELTEQFRQLSEDLKSQNIQIDFRYLNFGCSVARDIKRSIEDAKKLLEFASTYPDFYPIIEKYSAYRNLVDHGWEYITE